MYPHPPTTEDTIATKHTIPIFLDAVWKLQPEGDVAFMSTKDWDTGTWTDHAGSPADYTIPPSGDLYFSPHLFTGNRRTRRMSAAHGRWLYADLDEVNPRKLNPVPTLAWETSPGRYQALWLLDRPIPRRRLEQLNQRLTYYTGADKGGWSLTKVLRVPGSMSHKRDTPFRVRLVMNTKTVHSVTDLTELLRDVETTGSTTTDIGPLPADADLRDRAVIMRRSRRKLTARAKQLLNTGTVLQSDDRSARMWELMVSLLRAGIAPPDVYVLVRATVWNKHAGLRREAPQLWREITKAKKFVDTADDTPPPTKPRANKGLLPNTLMYDDFMRRDWERPTWLVDGVWTAGAYGILAGEYKAFKTMLLLDLALSVASGEPFLGKHRVIEPGMVAYIHEEGRPWSIHDRMSRLAHMKGLTDDGTPSPSAHPAEFEITFKGRSLPISITSLPRLNLRDPESQAAVMAHAASTQPKLMIFETFYLLSGGATESDISEVSPMLEFLAHLSHEYKTAVILSHHFHKSTDDKRFLDRVAGSNIFGRWYESGLFVERHGKDEDNTVNVHSSHRDGSAHTGRLQLVWTGDGDEATLAINHLEMNDDPDEDAASVVIDLGKLNVGEWLATVDADTRAEYVRYFNNLKQPVAMMRAKKDLDIKRTEHVQAIAKAMGLTTYTEDGIRYVSPPSS